MPSRHRYTCPKCGSQMFNVDADAFLNARGKNVEKLPMSCRSCGHEGTAKEFSEPAAPAPTEPVLSSDEDPEQW